MKTYMMSSYGFFDTYYREYETDKEAWETLRKSLPYQWVTLYRRDPIYVPVNNADEAIPLHDAKYTTQKIIKSPKETSILLPIVFGSSDEEWSFENDNIGDE